MTSDNPQDFWIWHLLVAVWINHNDKHGSHRSQAMKFSDLFLTFSWPSPNFYWPFAVWKHDILTFSGIHMGHTDEKITVAIIWHKIIVICHLYVPCQLNYGWIYKMSKNYSNTFPDFLIVLSGDCETEQQHHGTDSQNLERGLQTDINSIFLTFSWLFGEFQNFLTHMKIYWLFPDFLRLSLFPDFFLTCGNPDKYYFGVSHNHLSYGKSTWLDAIRQQAIICTNVD